MKTTLYVHYASVTKKEKKNNDHARMTVATPTAVTMLVTRTAVPRGGRDGRSGQAVCSQPPSEARTGSSPVLQVKKTKGRAARPLIASRSRDGQPLCQTPEPGPRRPAAPTSSACPSPAWLPVG